MRDLIVAVNKDLGGVVPSEIQVIPYGVMIETPKGPFTLDEAAAAEILREFETHKNDMVIDYEHQTFAEPPVEAPAAGWIKQLVNKGAEGIWAVLEWTDKAKAYIANREYRYVSPVFLKRKSDNRVIRLINVALTNQPNIDGMVPLLNKLSAVSDQYNKFGSEPHLFEEWHRNHDKSKEVSMDKEILKLLGLAESATLQDAMAAINKLKTPVTVVANKGVLDALGLKEGATESEVTGTIMAMKQGSTQVTELANQVKTLTDKLAAMQTTDLVGMAMKEGKITPAQKEWAENYAKTDPEGFQVFVAKAPVVVVQGKVITDQPADGSKIDDTQTQINKMCGVDEETFKKYAPKE